MIHNQNLKKIQQTSFGTSAQKNQLFKLEFLQIFTTASLLKKQLFCNYCRVLFLKTTGKRQKKTIEKGEKKTKNERKSNNNKYFFTCTFFHRKIYILSKNIFGRT